MKFAIQVNSSPYHSQGGESAYQFITAALAMGHEITRVFFYYDGIYQAFRYASPPDNEIQISQRWTTLIQQYDIDSVLCISAAQRRGLLSDDEAQRQNKHDKDLALGFRMGGLGLWVDATLKADRCLIFGGA